MHPRRVAIATLTAAALAAAGVTAAAQDRTLISRLVISDNGGANPAVAALDGGGFVATWSRDGIEGRTFDSDGAPTSEPLAVHPFDVGGGRHPAVARSAGGGFVVVWHVVDTPDEEHGIRGRRYDSSAAPLGSAFNVGPAPLHYGSPSVAGRGDAGFVVVWEAKGAGDDDGAEILARLFDQAGAPEGDAFVVNDETTGQQETPTVAGDASGNFVVAWSDRRRHSSIIGRRFASDGSRLGTEFEMSNPRLAGWSYGTQDHPEIAMEPHGSFVIAWDAPGYYDGHYYGDYPVIRERYLYRREFTADGLPLSESDREFSASFNLNYRPSVAMRDDGHFVVAWTAYDYEGCYGRFCDGTYGPASVAVRAYDCGGEHVDSAQGNTHAVPRQTSTAAAALDGGSFVVAWSGDHGDGSRGVAASLFDVRRRAGCNDTSTSTTSTTLPLSHTCAHAVTAAGPAPPTSADALAILNAAIGGGDDCDPCRCDVNGSGELTSNDALAALRHAIALPAPLACPRCL